MKKCEHCNVTVNTQNSTCPLCFQELTNIENSKDGNDMFKTREVKKDLKHKSLLYKIFIFISIIATTVCVLTNLMTQILPLWSLIVIIGIVYCWVLIRHTILSERSIFEKLFLQVGVILALLFACEWVSNGSKWMVDYVAPSISIAVILVLFILSQALKYHKGLLAFFIMTCLLTLISGFILIFKASTFNLLNIIAVVIGAISILGMIIFNWNVLKTEFSKKFHV